MRPLNTYTSLYSPIGLLIRSSITRKVKEIERKKNSDIDSHTTLLHFYSIVFVINKNSKKKFDMENENLLGPKIVYNQ